VVTQQIYMIKVRQFPDQPALWLTILGSLPLAITLVGFGIFFVITDRLKWPKFFSKPSSSGGETSASIS
jgi:hypothetical protein